MEANLKSNNQSSSDIQPNKFFAEVVQSGLQFFVGQCWKWDNFPRFGQFVQVECGNILIIGCISQIQTGSSDPMHMPFTYQKTEAELKAEQPQIFEFLKTTFSAQVLGYTIFGQDNAIQATPPSPCKIHSFIKECEKETILNFFQQPFYLNVIFSNSNQNINIDELLLAIIQNLSNQQILTKKILSDFCQTFSILAGNDYRRLKMFLKRAETIVKTVD